MSRSWVRKLSCRSRSSGSISWLRACCIIQLVSGFLVHAKYLVAATADRDEDGHIPPTQPDPSDATRYAASPVLANQPAEQLTNLSSPGDQQAVVSAIEAALCS